MKAPSYELAKHLAKILNRYITLNNYYNVINLTSLANDLTKLQIHDNHTLITFDVKDLYVNIPIDETLVTIKSKLLENNDAQENTTNTYTIESNPVTELLYISTIQNKVFPWGLPSQA
jgi:hypothetical protein